MAHDCYMRMRSSGISLSLVTIMVSSNISSCLTHSVTQRGLLAPDEIKDVDVRAVRKKVFTLLTTKKHIKTLRSRVKNIYKIIQGRSYRVPEAEGKILSEHNGERNPASLHISDQIQAGHFQHEIMRGSFIIKQLVQIDEGKLHQNSRNEKKQTTSQN